jgi:hypothetical protein
MTPKSTKVAGHTRRPPRRPHYARSPEPVVVKPHQRGTK